jgi:hypothetical protein
MSSLQMLIGFSGFQDAVRRFGRRPLLMESKTLAAALMSQ